MELGIHFAKHGHKFGLTDPAEYESMADEFMFGNLGASMKEGFRPNGKDRIRQDFVTTNFGVACITPAYVRTFYPPEAWLIRKRGGIDGFFKFECFRTDL